MAHFAEVKDGIVQRVIVADQSFIDSGAVGDPSTWIQTSYNMSGGDYKRGSTEQEKASLKTTGTKSDTDARNRKNYAGVGYSYDPKRDAFIPPTPFKSWLLNEDTCNWESPIPYPNDGKTYEWDEDKIAWVLSNIQR